MNGMAVAAGFGLRNKPDRGSVWPGSPRIGRFIAGPNNNGDLLDSGRERLFDQDAEQRFLVSVAVDKGLERQVALTLRSGSNDSFSD